MGWAEDVSGHGEGGFDGREDFGHAGGGQRGDEVVEDGLADRQDVVEGDDTLFVHTVGAAEQHLGVHAADGAGQGRDADVGEVTQAFGAGENEHGAASGGGGEIGPADL